MLVSENKQILHIGKSTATPLFSTPVPNNLTLINFNTKSQISSLFSTTKDKDMKSLIQKYLRVSDGEETPLFEKVSTRKDCVFLQTVLKEVWGYGSFTGGMLGVGIEDVKLEVPLNLSLLGFSKISGIEVGQRCVMGRNQKEELYVWGCDFTGENLQNMMTPTKIEEPKSQINGKISQTKFTSYSSWNTAIYTVYNKQLFFIGKAYCSSLTSPYLTKIIFSPSKTNIRGVSCGPYHILVWDEEGKLFGWGSTKNGRLGQLSSFSHNHLLQKPHLIQELKHQYVANANCGMDHGVALTITGLVYEWGRQYVTLLKGRREFNKYQFKSPIIKIDVVDNHSICLSAKGQVYQWGHHQIETLEVEHYPTAVERLKGMKIKDAALSENMIVLVRQQEECLKSKSEFVIEKSLKGTNRRTFVDQMVLTNLNLYKLQDNHVRMPSFLSKKEKRGRPNTSKNYIIKTNNCLNNFSKIQLDKTWKNKDEKITQTIKDYERKSEIRFSILKPPSQAEMKKSVEKLRLKYTKKSRGFYQPTINQDLLLLQHLICVLNQEAICHVFHYVLRKKKEKKDLAYSLKIEKYFHAFSPAMKIQQIPNPRSNASFCIRQILQHSVKNSLKQKIAARVLFYKSKVSKVKKQIQTFYIMSKHMKQQLNILLDYEILSNCRINKTSTNPKILRFISFVKPQLQTLKCYDFERKFKPNKDVKNSEITLKIKEKFGEILPIHMFSRNNPDIVSQQQSKFVHQAPAFRLAAEENGRQQLIDYIYKVNIRIYINELIKYQKQKVSFIKSNIEQILLQKARLLLTGKSKKIDTLVNFHSYIVSEQVLAIALVMDDFPKFPKVSLKLTLNGQGGEEDKSVFQKYVEIVSKKISYAKAKKK